MSAVLTNTFTKVSTIIIFVCLMLMAAYPALAQEATSPAAAKRVETRKAQLQEKIDTRRETLQDEQSSATRKMTAIRERVATKEAALKQRLATFRDKTKALTAERINATLANINEKMTTQMSRHLEKMTQLLDKLEERVNTNTPDIKDPTKAREAIAAAKDKIAFAQAAVEAQKEKDYVIVVTSETTVRADAQAAKEQLHLDLKAVRELVIEAKQAVANAIRVAKSGSVTKEGTPNGQ